MKTILQLTLVLILSMSACNMNQHILEDEVSQHLRKTYNATDVVVETFAIPRDYVQFQNKAAKGEKDVYIVKFSFMSEHDESSAYPVTYQGIAGVYEQRMYPIDEDAHKFFHFNREEAPFEVNKDSLRAFVNKQITKPPVITLVAN